MRSLSLLGSVLICMLGLLAFSMRPAQAYIDAGTGSYLLQLAIGSILAALFMIKAFWNKIKTALQRLFHREPDRAND
jgi:hypothetical protein